MHAEDAIQKPRKEEICSSKRGGPDMTFVIYISAVPLMHWEI